MDAHRGHGTAGAVALLAALALAAFAAPSQAAYPAGQNGRIVYECGSENASILDLCAINPDGSGRVNLTNTPASTFFEARPSFSPDGRRIVFRRLQAGEPFPSGLSLISADGSGLTPLVPTTTDSDVTATDPTYAPDGRQVFFSRGSVNLGDLYRINPNGSGEVNLTNGAFGAEPSVSPDGMTVAFSRFITAPCVPGPGVCSGPEVFVMGIDGSAQRILSPPGREESDSVPAFGPDGRIAFVRSGNMGGDIWVMNADGSGQRNLTNTPGVSEDEPEFSPDGSMIVYRRAEGSLLYLMSSDGSAQRRLASTPAPAGYAEESGASWQPIHKCRGRLVTIYGDDGPDVLKGTKRADVIMGFGGKDVLRGRGGNDRICGGRGKDKLIAGGGAKDRCVGGQGKDKAKGCERGKI